jgi:hypothetical protein
MVVDQRGSDNALRKIFEDIINDSVKRRQKGGKGSNPGAVYGYLAFLSQFIAGKAARKPRAFSSSNTALTFERRARVALSQRIAAELATQPSNEPA